MLRVGMAALMMLVGSATAMAAEAPTTPGATLSARQQSLASVAKAQTIDGRVLPAPRLRVGGTVSLATSSAVTSAGRQTPRDPSLSARARAQSPAPDLSSYFGWIGSDGDEASLAYTVNQALSLGLGYRLVTDEDLKLKVAETGAVDSGYTNHSVFVRAHWQF